MSKPALKLEPEYRSKLEKRFAAQLEAAGIRFGYERRKVKFVIPERVASYTPDWDFDGSIIICETKGYFRTANDRQRLVLIKEQHPELDIRLVFQDASKPIYKGSKTSYGKWAQDHGFRWADKGTAPEAWINEIKEQQSEFDVQQPVKSKPTQSRRRSQAHATGSHRSRSSGALRKHQPYGGARQLQHRSSRRSRA